MRRAIVVAGLLLASVLTAPPIKAEESPAFSPWRSWSLGTQCFAGDVYLNADFSTETGTATCATGRVEVQYMKGGLGLPYQFEYTYLVRATFDMQAQSGTMGFRANGEHAFIWNGAGEPFDSYTISCESTWYEGCATVHFSNRSPWELRDALSTVEAGKAWGYWIPFDPEHAPSSCEIVAGADDGCSEVASNFRYGYANFRATVTPEPSTWVLLGTGLLAVGGIARRHRSTPR